MGATPIPSPPSPPEEVGGYVMDPVGPLPTPDFLDIRGMSLSDDLREFLVRYAKLVPTSDEIKTPFDYWAFLEPVFAPPLRASMISETGNFPSVKHPPPPASMPAYHWQWALEDCTHSELLTEEERAEIFSKLAPPENRSSVCDELGRTIHSLDILNKQLGDSFLKLRRWIAGMEGSELAQCKLRKKALVSLLNFSHTLLADLHQEQLLDSIEELHAVSAAACSEVAVVVDDCDRVRCLLMSKEEVGKLLLKRAALVGSPETESVVFSYPFSAGEKGLCPRLPQIGPFCHICRQRKPDMAKCSARLAAFYASADSKDLRTPCHRRFCTDCLLAYNWPRPCPESWKCPICLRICTCDRCVRNVFLKSLKAFVLGGRGALSKSVPELPQVESVWDFFALVGTHSPFGNHSEPSPKPVQRTPDYFASGLPVRTRRTKGSDPDPKRTRTDR